MPGKHTIEDIARLAGVSKTTVSRVLNHKPDVDPATRERIQRIIEEQAFVPNITASGLAGGRNRLLGMLIPSLTWPLIPDLIRGIAEVVNETPYELVLYSFKDEDLERDRSDVINRLLATQLTAGLLAVFPGRASLQLTQLYKQGFPVVIIDDQQEQITPWVGVDNITGAYSAVRHLINLGHQRIAHIQGPPEYLASHHRYHGYRKAMLEAGIVPDPDLLLEGDFLPPSGRACASKFFELPPAKRPTAIFTATDQMAYGVLAAAEEYGLSVPGDVALVGFDDDAPSVHVRPALTTVRQPVLEMGQRAMQLLLSIVPGLSAPRVFGQGERKRYAGSEWTSAMQNGSPPFVSGQVGNTESGEPGASIPEPIPVRIQLPTSLVVRASCGADHHIFSNSIVE